MYFYPQSISIELLSIYHGTGTDVEVVKLMWRCRMNFKLVGKQLIFPQCFFCPVSLTPNRSEQMAAPP